MTLTIVDRFNVQGRREQQVKLDAGEVRKVDELELLEPEQLPSLARLSLVMLIVGAIFFVGLNLIAYYWQMHTLALNLSFWGVIAWLVANIVAYIVVLPIHEALHGLAFALWGGRPFFGAKLPLALYCGAKNQLFRRDQYLVVGLAPVVVITLAGIVLTLLMPGLATYVLLATAGNVSGAAGDVWVAARLWKQPSSVLVEDTELGYRAWEVELRTR